MRAVEARAIGLTGGDGFELMRRAGAAAWCFVLAHWPGAQRIVVACGPGNNGGDGYVLALHALQAGRDVRVLHAHGHGPRSPLGRLACAAFVEAGGVVALAGDAWPDCDLVVDAVFGIGFKGRMDEAAAAMLDAIASLGVPVLALDVPSGVDASNGSVPGAAVCAARTLQFIAGHAGLATGAALDHVGEVATASLDLPAEAFDGVAPVAWQLDASALEALLPRRARTAHKGDAGHVLVAGGNVGMGGAALLAAEAALRSSELRYRAISELAADYAYSLSVGADGSARFEWATKAFERISGYAPEEIADLAGLMRMVHEDDHPAIGAQLEHLRKGQTIDLEIRIRTKAGEERWISHRSRPVVNAESLVTHVYSSGQDITDRKRFETELIAAREQAEEMARLKSAFLANMSHEIRTPLTGILGFAGVLAEEVGEQHREFVQLIEKSGRRLLDTLNSVLDLAQLESDGVRIAASPLDVVDEVGQVVQLLAPLAEEKGIALHLDATGDEVVAPLDAACLNRILHNLVGNAIKFTEVGRVVVTVRPSGDRVHIRVTDTGIGIDAEFVPHLFEEFKQESTGQGRSHEGSGLGLAITRKLVELMGGSISVESEKGQGSTFTIWFPRIVMPPAIGGDGQTMEARLVEPPEPAGPDRRDEEDEPTLADEEARHEELAEPSQNDLSQNDLSQNDLLPDEAETLGTFEVEPLFASDLLDEIDVTAPEHPAPTDDTWTFYDEFTATDAADVDATMNAEELLPDALADDALAHDAEAPGAPEEVPDQPEPDPVDEPLEAGPAEPAQESAGVVLIVEDNDETRLLIERVLQGTYRVEAVSDARTALQRMASRAYDALVLDINLGGRQTGVEVLRVARSLPGYEQVVAVALTAYALPGDGDRFLAEGFDHYVSKPFTRRGLLDAIAAGRTKVTERS